MFTFMQNSFVKFNSHSFSLFPGKAPQSSNNKEQTQRKELLTAAGKFWIVIVNSMKYR